MPIEQLQIAEGLRKFLLTKPGFPVRGGEFLLDGLNDEGDSISIQLTPGRVIKTYLNGGRIMRQPFNLYYRSTNTDNNLNKSKMIQHLNDIGSWLDQVDSPQIADNIKTIKLEQTTLAALYIQDKIEIGYLATYLFDYEVF
jgi:hypothetical protein